MNVGLIDTGNFNRAECVSRVDERIALTMAYPAFILPTYADKGERRRTRKSRWNAILSAYRVRLRPPTSGYSQRISSETPVTVVTMTRPISRRSGPRAHAAEPSPASARRANSAYFLKQSTTRI